MASNYPASLDSFDTIAADKKTSEAVGGRTHRAMHNDLGDAIEAVQAELGTDPAGGSATVKARFDVIEANDWVTSARIAANAVGSSELADAAVDTAAIADGAVTAVKLGSDVRIGNLLTANQASVETDTTGLSSTQNCTIARSTAQALHGSASLAITCDGAGIALAGTPAGSAGAPVVPGETYTASVSIRSATAARTIKAYLIWRTGAYAGVSDVQGTSATSTTTGWTEVKVTATAPATAAYAQLVAWVEGASASEVHYADAFGVWRGVGGRWAMPGTVVPGTSPILSSADGTQWVLAVDNDGVLTAEEL